ncbi:MAG: hypothetical protein PVJ63_06525 [Thioalkalispiraceae bacterium]|jgi:hypothetical protein
MSLQFNPQPGPRERHLQRKANNPLFPDAARNISQDDILQARQQDEMELVNFMNDFQVLVQEAINLKPETDSEVILDLKERLDKSYAQCCTLPGDQAQIKQAVEKLIDAIMNAVRAGAGNDPKALQELDEEVVARKSHYALHEHKLVADLMLEQSPIASEELVPSLLSEQHEGLVATLNLFEEDALATIYQQAKTLLQTCKQDGEQLPQAWQRLETIETFLTRLPAHSSPLN